MQLIRGADVRFNESAGIGDCVDSSHPSRSISFLSFHHYLATSHDKIIPYARYASSLLKSEVSHEMSDAGYAFSLVAALSEAEAHRQCLRVLLP